mmetsp:Transcript_24985/g.58216  ORF Transcript_24985/g.58216 Transcript_24985/m.58216 type:complete len:234 (+) Transcript_24985:520-1221(+)
MERHSRRVRGASHAAEPRPFRAQPQPPAHSLAEHSACAGDGHVWHLASQHQSRWRACIRGAKARAVWARGWRPPRGRVTQRSESYPMWYHLVESQPAQCVVCAPGTLTRSSQSPSGKSTSWKNTIASTAPSTLTTTPSKSRHHPHKARRRRWRQRHSQRSHRRRHRRQLVRRRPRQRDARAGAASKAAIMDETTATIENAKAAHSARSNGRLRRRRRRRRRRHSQRHRLRCPC